MNWIQLVRRQSLKTVGIVSTLFLAVSFPASANDFDAGKRVFNKCRACHAIGPKVRKLPGPVLNGVIGREWGAIEGYKYSGGREGSLLAITEADPQTWSLELLRAYLKKPKDVIPRGKMQFAGLRKDEDIENLLCYLASFDADGNEIDPEPVLAAASGEDADGADDSAEDASADDGSEDGAEETPDAD